MLFASTVMICHQNGANNLISLSLYIYISCTYGLCIAQRPSGGPSVAPRRPCGTHIGSTVSRRGPLGSPSPGRPNGGPSAARRPSMTRGLRDCWQRCIYNIASEIYLRSNCYCKVLDPMFRCPDPATFIMMSGPQLHRIFRRSCTKLPNERFFGAGDSFDTDETRYWGGAPPQKAKGAGRFCGFRYFLNVQFCSRQIIKLLAIFEMPTPIMQFLAIFIMPSLCTVYLTYHFIYG